GGGHRSAYVVDADEQLHKDRRLGRRRPDAALDSFRGSGVDAAVAHRVVGVDLPREELGIEWGGLLRHLRKNLELQYWIRHFVYLSNPFGSLTCISAALARTRLSAAFRNSFSVFTATRATHRPSSRVSTSCSRSSRVSATFTASTVTPMRRAIHRQSVRNSGSPERRTISQCAGSITIAAASAVQWRTCDSRTAADSSGRCSAAI